jgi:hypothetical protein
MLFGKRYPQNFNAPFSSFNFIDFWSRWHMSLTFWLRDYVYTPLVKLLMQTNLPRSYDPYLGVTAYFIVFFLIGIWHGSTVIFAVYGLVLALGVSINKLYQTLMAVQRLDLYVVLLLHDLLLEYRGNGPADYRQSRYRRHDGGLPRVDGRCYRPAQSLRRRTGGLADTCLDLALR